MRLELWGLAGESIQAGVAICAWKRISDSAKYDLKHLPVLLGRGIHRAGSAGIPACGFTEHPCSVFPPLEPESKDAFLEPQAGKLALLAASSSTPLARVVPAPL